MMRYRAVLKGVEGLERPRQVFDNDLAGAHLWAKEEAAKHDPKKWPLARVVVYETVEEVREVVWPAGSEGASVVCETCLDKQGETPPAPGAQV